MKILGIGVDIVENKRIQKSIKNPLFKKRIYSSKELKQSYTVNKSQKKILKSKILNFFYQFRMKKITQLHLQLFKHHEIR